MEPLLQIQSLSLSYHQKSGETRALQNIDLTVEKGQFISILGPSGCGKSTLLSCIAGLDHPSEGTITLNSPAKTVGYMFQHDLLLEWRSVFQNACLGLEVRGALNDDTKAYVKVLLNAYGLGGFLTHKPSQLSGGMRQRVALVRTLALKPELLLLDEPYSALDYQTRLTVADEIWRILRTSGKTALLVTHDISEAISLGDRVVILSRRPGHIIKDITIDLGSDRTPLASRSLPAFQEYFQTIWEVMQHA